MRPGVLLLVACLAGAAALLPAPAEAKDGTVVVTDPGGGQSVTIRLRELGNPDINNQDYQLESGGRISGYSISRVMRAAEAEAGGWLDLEALPSVEVDRPSGGPIRLTRAQFLDTGERPPVFYESGGTTVFVMPGPPGREYVFRFTPIAIRAGSQDLLDVSLTASPRKPREGQPVRVTATVRGAPSGTRLTYRWSFSGEPIKTTSGPVITHRFQNRGRRSVVLTVNGEGVEGQATLLFDVTGGPDDSGGRDPDRVPEEDAGTGSGFDSAGSGEGGYGSSPFGTGEGGTGGAPPTGDSRPRQAEQPAREQARQSVDGLEDVSGLLIDPAASATAPEPGEAAGEGATPGDGGFGLSGEAATLFGVGLLIALGGLIEARLLFRRS